MSMRPDARRKTMKAAKSGRNSFHYLYDSRSDAGRQPDLTLRPAGNGYEVSRTGRQPDLTLRPAGNGYEVSRMGRQPDLTLRPAGSGYAVGRTGTRQGKRSIVNAGYVIFLALMCIATVLMCVRFLQLKETVTLLNRQNAALETQHTELKRENDARYENVTNSIDWDHIRDVAINKLNMKYADKEQIIWYNSASDGYVHQYTDVPDKDSR